MFIQWQGYTLNVSKILFIVKHKDVYINGTAKFCVKIFMENNTTILFEGG